MRTRSEMTTCNMAHHKIDRGKQINAHIFKQTKLGQHKKRFTKNLQLTVLCFKLSKWYFFVYEAKKKLYM